MKDIKDKFENLKDKAEGEIKENVGKVTGDQELELEGKIKKKVSEVKDKITEVKDEVLEKINDKIDESEK
ncbi:CsbD family protein [Phascolarctobacterium sp.]|uniref:CsbD family protein n=1 Tax=Phascolarctobacterium sp. TaxID=2049039 RepID=UPI003078877B